MNHLQRSFRHSSTHQASVLLPISTSLKNSLTPSNTSTKSFSSDIPRSCPTTATSSSRTLARFPLTRKPFSSSGQSHSNLLQPGCDRQPGSLDVSQFSLHSDEASLDELAAALDARLAEDPDRMPELPDLAALKPPRLQRYLPGMQRQWYIDHVEGVRRRLMRAFSRPQLEHVCRMLGFCQAEERGLSAQGLQRLGALRFAHPELPVKDLVALVLAEQNPAFEAPVKRKDPSDAAYSKAKLVEFVMFEHWALTDPDLIPAEQDFEGLVKEFQASSRLFELPYHELFLLYIEQAQDRTKNQLRDLSRRTNVTLELVDEPARSSTGLLVRGTMKEREKFWSLFGKRRRPIYKHYIPVPVDDDLGRLIHVADGEKVLKCLAERAGCYLELGEMEDAKRVLVAYSFDKSNPSERVLDALTQYKILSTELASAPVLMSSGPSAGPLALVPFLPSTKPPWFISCRATAFARLAHPVSSTAVDHSSVRLSELAGLGGQLDDWMSCSDTPDSHHHLLGDDAQSSVRIVNLNAYFGHFVRPKRSSSSSTTKPAELKKKPVFLEEFLPLRGGQVTTTDDHHDHEEGSGLEEIGGLGRSKMSVGGDLVNDFVFLPALHSLGSITRLSETSHLYNNSTDNNSDVVESASHNVNSSEHADGASQVYEPPSLTATIEVFKRTSPASQETSSKVDWDEAYEVTRLDDGTVVVDKVWRRLAVVMLPSHPMDVLLERERRAPLPAAAILPHIAQDGDALCVDGVRYLRVTRHALQTLPLGRVGRGTVEAQELRRTGAAIGEGLWTGSRITIKEDESREGLETLVETAIWLAGGRSSE